VILLVIVVVAVISALYRAVWELWVGAERILSAFATLLEAFVHTLPRLLLAGVIALAGLWLMPASDPSRRHAGMAHARPFRALSCAVCSEWREIIRFAKPVHAPTSVR
jgi:hypothetical protein